MQTQSGPVRPKAYWWVAILALVQSPPTPCRKT